jgi:hypothetical protein
VSLSVCLDCTTAFAVGVPQCPHCGSERQAEQGSAAALGLHARGRVEEDSMPKITRHGGPSFREYPGTGEPMTAVEGDELTGDGSGRALPPVEDEGGEQPSVGSSSETSSAKPLKKSEPSGASRQKRARTAGNRSRQARTEAKSGTAGSTDTSGPETDAADE